MKALIIDFHILLVILGSIFSFLDLDAMFLKITEILFLSTISFLKLLFLITKLTSLVRFFMMSNNLLSSLSNFF